MYIACDKDDPYEFPYIFADTAKEMAELINSNKKTIYSAAFYYKKIGKHNRVGQYKVFEVNTYDECDY